MGGSSDEKARLKSKLSGEKRGWVMARGKQGKRGGKKQKIAPLINRAKIWFRWL